MKNKEIEELLNKLSKISLRIYKVEPTYCEELITRGELKLLLSYIEQLENNRDKALKKLNKYRNRKDHYCLWCMEYIDNADIIHILKGDSDEWNNRRKVKQDKRRI